jgi:hypothetical protein
MRPGPSTCRQLRPRRVLAVSDDSSASATPESSDRFKRLYIWRGHRSENTSAGCGEKPPNRRIELLFPGLGRDIARRGVRGPHCPEYSRGSRNLHTQPESIDDCSPTFVSLGTKLHRAAYHQANWTPLIRAQPKTWRADRIVRASLSPTAPCSVANPLRSSGLMSR